MSAPITLDLTRWFEEVHDRIPKLQRKILETCHNTHIRSHAPLRLLPVWHKLSQNLPHIGIFLNHIHVCPIEFSRAVVSEQKSSGFASLVRFVIPSAFGYFCCMEFLAFAFSFYQQVLELDPPAGVAGQVLAPLLNSCVSFRFIESFFNALGGIADQPLEPPILLNLFKAKLPLFPREIVYLFRKLATAESLRTVFWEHFFQPQLKNWLLIFPDASKLNSVFSRFFGNKQNLTALAKIINEIQLFVSFPSFLWSADQLFLPHLLTVKHLAALAHFAEKVRLLPPKFTVAEFVADVDPSITFWAKEYPRMPLDSCKDFLTNVAELELYIGMRRKMEQMASWSELMFVGRLMAGWQGDAAFLTHRLNSDCAILGWKIRDKLEAFDRDFEAAVACVIAREFTALLETVAPDEMEKIRRFSFDLRFAPGMTQLQIVLEVMRIVMKLEEKVCLSEGEVLRFIVDRFFGERVASVVVLLSCVAIPNPFIQEILSDEEIKIWGTFASRAFALPGDHVSWTAKTLEMNHEISRATDWLKAQKKNWL
jgi:hypothetical protein